MKNNGLFDMLIVLGVAGFFAIISPYGAVTYLEFPSRWLYWSTTVGTGWALYHLSHRLLSQRFATWVWALGTSFVASLPVLAIIYFVQQMLGEPVAPSYLPELFVSVWLICLALVGLFLLVHGQSQEAAPSEVAVKPQLNEQLPFEYREANILALQADDHYVHVHTNGGVHLHYIRLRDAIALMEGVAGVQVHRSWWVALEAIRSVKREDGKWQISLSNDVAVPVSRSGVSALKDASVLLER